MKEPVRREHRARRDEHWWFGARRDLFTRLLDAWVALPPGAAILDLGPGFGVNLPVLGARGRVTALDVDRDSLRDCAARGAAHTVLADAHAPPLCEGSFDLVAALDVLEHLEHDQSALRAWARLLAPNGRLLLTVPALPLLWGRQDVLSGHFRRYRRQELAQRVRAAGLRIERLSFFNTVLFPPILGVRLLMRPFLRRTARGDHSDLDLPSFGLGGLLRRAFAAEGRWLVGRDLPLGVSLLCLARPENGA